MSAKERVKANASLIKKNKWHDITTGSYWHRVANSFEFGIRYPLSTFLAI